MKARRYAPSAFAWFSCGLCCAIVCLTGCASSAPGGWLRGPGYAESTKLRATEENAAPTEKWGVSDKAREIESSFGY